MCAWYARMRGRARMRMGDQSKCLSVSIGYFYPCGQRFKAETPGETPETLGVSAECGASAGRGVMSGEKGVVAGSPADLFENIDAHDAQMVADAAPFRDRPQPIGGSRKGIPNKRTAQLRELYLKMGLPHPVLAMGQMLRLGVDGLSRELSCDMKEAGELYRKIAADLMPYIEGKQPTLLHVQASEALPLVLVGDVGAARQALDQGRGEGVMAIDDDVDAALAQFEENQRVKAATPAASHEAPSHDEAKPLKRKRNPAPAR